MYWDYWSNELRMGKWDGYKRKWNHPIQAKGPYRPRHVLPRSGPISICPPWSCSGPNRPNGTNSLLTQKRLSFEKHQNYNMVVIHKSYGRDTQWTTVWSEWTMNLWKNLWSRSIHGRWMRINVILPCIESPYVLVKNHRTSPTIFMKWTKDFGLFILIKQRELG